jgi:uroporphyrinogen-III synthase
VQRAAASEAEAQEHGKGVCPLGVPFAEGTQELLKLETDHSTSTTAADNLLLVLASTVRLVSESRRAHGRAVWEPADRHK